MGLKPQWLRLLTLRDLKELRVAIWMTRVRVLGVQFLASPYILKSTKIISSHVCSLWPAEAFYENICLIECTSLQQNHMYPDLASASSEKLPRAVCDAFSRAEVLILPQIKANWRLSRCACVLVDEGSLGWSRPRRAWRLLQG